MEILSCQKHLFNLDPGVHYINGAYMSPLLQSVEAAGMEGIVRKRQPHRLSPSDFFTETDVLRALFAQLIHAPSASDVALVPSVSYGMAIVANNLPTQRGRKIVLAGDQFPSNVYPWMTLARDRGLELELVPMPADTNGRSARWNENLLAAIDERTALVAIAHVHWANGTLFDLRRLAEKAHQNGGLLVVDGTQSVGALPMDVQELGIDALVCAGYKWLMGPYGLGYAWFGPAFLNGRPLEENWINRYNSQDFARLVDYQEAYQPGAMRYDVGERSNFILVPMGIAALRQIIEWRPERIQQYCTELVQAHLPLWHDSGYWTEVPEGRASHLFGLQLPEGIAPAAFQQALHERHISVSVRGHFIRISPHVYNDAADLQALSEVITAFRQ